MMNKFADICVIVGFISVACLVSYMMFQINILVGLISVGLFLMLLGVYIQIKL